MTSVKLNLLIPGSQSEKALINSLVVDEIKINNIEKATRDEASSEQWKKERNLYSLLQNLTLSRKGKGTMRRLQWI